VRGGDVTVAVAHGVVKSQGRQDALLAVSLRSKIQAKNYENLQSCFCTSACMILILFEWFHVLFVRTVITLKSRSFVLQHLCDFYCSRLCAVHDQLFSNSYRLTFKM